MSLTKDSQNRSVVPLTINNKDLPLNSSKIFPVTSAKSGETVHYYQGADLETCDQACDAAWTAFKTWKRATVGQRRDLLLKVASLYEERADEFVKVQMLETSCEEMWARNNVALSVAYVKEIAACISSVRGKSIPLPWMLKFEGARKYRIELIEIAGSIPPTDKPDTMTFVYKEAIGPILVIPP